jgi:hypothetical protein
MSNLRQDLKNTIEQIRKKETDHLKLLHAVLQADGRKLFPADLIVTGAVQRSLMVTKGFLSMLRSQNYVVDPKNWTGRRPCVRWWAALKMKESQCPEPVRITHPA